MNQKPNDSLVQGLSGVIRTQMIHKLDEILDGVRKNFIAQFGKVGVKNGLPARSHEMLTNGVAKKHKMSRKGRMAIRKAQLARHAKFRADKEAVGAKDSKGRKLVTRRSRVHKEKIACLQCGKLYWPKRKDQKFHTQKCRDKYNHAPKPQEASA